MRNPVLIGCIVVLTLALFVGYSRCAEQTEMVKIGVIFPMTGSASPTGLEIIRGMEMAVWQWNEERGGVKVGGKKYKIKIFYYDDQNKPELGAEHTIRAIELDKVVAIVGCMTSSVTLAQAPIIEKHRIPWLSLSIHPAITESGYRYAFNVHYTMRESERGVADDIVKQGGRSIGCLYVNNDYGKGKYNHLKKIYEDEYKAGKISVQSYSSGETDFYPMITAIKAADPQGVYLISYTPEFAAILKQMEELKFRPKTIWATSLLVPVNLVKILGEKAYLVEGVRVIGLPDPKVKSARQEDYMKAAKGKYPGEDWTRWPQTPLGYDAFWRLLLAMESEGSFAADKICKGLRTIDWEGIRTWGGFNEKGELPIFLHTHVLHKDASMTNMGTMKIKP